MLAAALTVISCTNHWQEIPMEGYILVKQSRGAELGYSPESGVRLLVRDGFVFKDLNRNGEVDVYEDWRRPLEGGGFGRIAQHRRDCRAYALQ